MEPNYIMDSIWIYMEGAPRPQARTETNANVPLGSIAMQCTLLNWASVPTPSR